eukprot:CAMPEP_0118648160 /NCGR_PEP_ID=MMETSP0785-20121206/9003_1 /TAXON_ID=91992 /ORGANISM="Bolidomonas pacifica, Strain CCMP 1866" /LENGTH=66 /DNA_ID=CAMNT_0006540325 /DNA_START=130 /DNA_END=327 /DNA_ORIENTATION=-
MRGLMRYDGGDSGSKGIKGGNSNNNDNNNNKGRDEGAYEVVTESEEDYHGVMDPAGRAEVMRSMLR